VSQCRDFSKQRDSIKAVRNIDNEIVRSWDLGSQLADQDIETRRSMHDKGNFYEDIHLTNTSASSPWKQILNVPQERLGQIRAPLNSLNQLAHLLNRRHEFLHTMGAFMTERWPGRTEIPVLDLFVAIQPLWRTFETYDLKRTKKPDHSDIYNPLELEKIDQLRELRMQVLRHLAEAVEDHGDHCELPPQAAVYCLAEVPVAYRPPTGACAFLQPADPEGRSWVLNRLYEGTGRYAGRFTAAMPSDLAERFVDAFRNRPGASVGGEEAGLLDLMTFNGDTLNVHPILTPWVLALPGCQVDWPTDKTRLLSDLHIRFRPGRDLLPGLVDRQQQLFCPVYLGGSGLDYSPPVIRFLSRFGPGELSTPALWSTSTEVDGCRCWPRLVCGLLTVKRRHWRVPTKDLACSLRGVSPERAFVLTNRWRLRYNLPFQVYLTEKVTDKRVKPQFLDFSSPTFCGLSRTSLETGEVVSLYEVLPSRDELPTDDSGKGWVVEIQLEY